MLESLSPAATPTAYLAFWVLLFVSFLIGWFFSRWYYKGKIAKANEECNLEKQRIRKTYEEKIEVIKASKVETPVVAASTVAGSTSEKPAVNFARVGKADASQKDDLKKISGVGKFIEEKLNNIGIYTYEQISNFTPEDMQTVTDLIEFFPGRIERDDWVGQARVLKSGGSTEFSKKVDNKEVDYDKEE
jgi:predicted flap endonuclease-1-like 5' DNA nuclease